MRPPWQTIGKRVVNAEHDPCTDQHHQPRQDQPAPAGEQSTDNDGGDGCSDQQVIRWQALTEQEQKGQQNGENSRGEHVRWRPEPG